VHVPHGSSLRAVDVGAEGKRRPFLPFLPCCRERSPPCVLTLKAPGGVRILEAAVSQAAHEVYFSNPQDNQVDLAVAINVDGVRADDGLQFKSARLKFEFGRSADFGDITKELRVALAAGDQHAWASIVRAVERGDATANHILPLAVIACLNA